MKFSPAYDGKPSMCILTRDLGPPFETTTSMSMQGAVHGSTTAEGFKITRNNNRGKETKIRFAQVASSGETRQMLHPIIIMVEPLSGVHHLP